MATGQHIAYVRVSTAEQNEERQVEALSKFEIDVWFKEKVSGKNIEDRSELKSMLNYVRNGDTVYVHDFSRLARNVKDLLDIIDELHNKGVSFVSNKESIDTSTPQGKLMLTMLGAIYEFERQIILDRQAEGIVIAKREGKYHGRKTITIDQDVFDEAYGRYQRREIKSMTDLANELHVSKSKLYKIIKQHEGVSARVR